MINSTLRTLEKNELLVQYIKRRKNLYIMFKNEIGDEFHYLFSCDNFNNQRKLYIKKKFRNRPNTLKFKEIMISKNKYDLQKLCRFVAIINKGVCPPS